MVTRIRKLLEHKQLTPTQFADLIGVGRPVISHILSERNKPSLEVVQRIISAFSELSLPWLLNGNGEMLASMTSPAPAVAPAPSISTMPGSQPAPASAAISPPIANAALPATRVLSAGPFPAPTAPILPVPFPIAMPAPEVAVPLGPTAGKVVRAPRFIPTKAAPVAPAVQEAAAPVEATVSQALPNTLFNELAPDPAATLPGLAALPSALLDAAVLPFLAKPGKAIRRIVIFYRDGSFADYQPEQ